MLITKGSQLPNLDAADALAFDLETNEPSFELGPGWRREGRVLGIAVGAPDKRAWYISLKPGDVLPAVAWRWWDRQVAHNPNRPVLGASINYDLDYAAQGGARIPTTIRDVLHAGRMLDMQGKYPSLDEMLRAHLGSQKTGDGLWQWLAAFRGKGNPTRKAQIGFLELAPPALVGEYAEGDVVELFELLTVVETKLKAREAWEWYLVEQELLPYLLKMRRRGIRVDVAKAERLQTEFGDEYADLLMKFGNEVYPNHWDNLTGAEKIDHLNVNSSANLARIYEKRGIIVPKTNLGAPSVKKEWLETQDDMLSKMVLRLRALSKVSGTFVESYILKHQINGRIHPELNQLFPRTLRMSSQNPNEQNIPSRDEVLAPLIRGLFLPEDGEDWGRVDFDQQEYRLTTHYGRGPGAEEARQAYRDDPKTDFHNLVGGWLRDAGFDLPRKIIKNANFSKVYRAGKPKFAATLGVDLEEGTRIFDLYDQMLPWVKQTAALAERTAESRGYVNILLRGMRMYFDHWAVDDWDLRRKVAEKNASNTLFAKTYKTREEAVAVGQAMADEVELDKVVRVRKADVYKAFNRVIQPSAAQLMKMGMVLLARSGVGDILGVPLVSVHDELGLSVPRTKQGREAFEEVGRCLVAAEEGQMSIPVTVSFEHGPDWGHLGAGLPVRKKLILKRRK